MRVKYLPSVDEYAGNLDRGAMLKAVRTVVNAWEANGRGFESLPVTVPRGELSEEKVYVAVAASPDGSPEPHVFIMDPTDRGAYHQARKEMLAEVRKEVRRNPRGRRAKAGELEWLTLMAVAGCEEQAMKTLEGGKVVRK
jgi:hypothetical protein